MFFQNTAILNRHLPSAKLYKARVQRAVFVKEGGSLERGRCGVCCCHTHCSIAVLRVRLYASQYHILQYATNFRPNKEVYSGGIHEGEPGLAVRNVGRNAFETVAR